MLWVLCLILTALEACAEPPTPCASRVYCYGPLLHTVQMARVFNDSKTFVDMKMKHPYETTLSNFDDFMQSTDDKPSKDQVKTFVDENFEEGNELDVWEPHDYVSNPQFLTRVSDRVVRDFARHLVEMWPVLGRKVKPEVIAEADQYSLLPVANGFIVPGGRFREYYYWDSYWIIRGLLISDMVETARGMLDNLISLVKTYQFVPNGGRLYYLNRSQPPLLTKMAMEYYKRTKDRKWLNDNIRYLNQELSFWLDTKTVSVEKNKRCYTLAQYKVHHTGPRPESYLDDFRTAEFYPDKDQLYMDLKSGAESGWDFSSRWIFDHRGGNVANLTHIETRRVIPADLNAYLCEAFKSISYFYTELFDSNQANYWHKLAIDWQQAIEGVLFDPEDGVWYDFDLKLSQPRKYFYPSNLAPLWTGCFDSHKKQSLGKRALKYLVKSGALETPGGIVASQISTGEQWDYPNAWAPLQAMVVEALDRSEAPDAVAGAEQIATRWIRANINGFRESGELFEKYDALQPGKFGGGGEYPVQSGFGWTNGVALEFIYKYFTNGGGKNVTNISNKCG